MTRRQVVSNSGRAREGVKSRRRDPEAPGGGGSRETSSLYDLLDADHELGAKREDVRLAVRKSDVAKHIAAPPVFS